MANEQTSARVSSIAAGLVKLTVEKLREIASDDAVAELFVANVKSVAASAMTQDETKGQ
jgi:hypothetical protein